MISEHSNMMNNKEYLVNVKEIYNNLLESITVEEGSSEKIQNFINFLESHNFRSDKNKIKFILHIIQHISNNHHRLLNFFPSIFQILSYFDKDYIKYYSNTELFTLFKSNKRIILFFIDKKVINVDELIASMMINESLEYSKYFYPEIKKLNQKNISITISKEEEENFEEKRRIGENSSRICYLIRNDLVIEFIKYVNQLNISLDSTLESSIFETNQFLLYHKHSSLIEYAAFYGSFQIFKYLYMNGVTTNKSLWLYAIHGFNPEIIHYLEEININLSSYEELFFEAIKCHHNAIAEYFELKIAKNFEKDKTLEYYNIANIPKLSIDRTKLHLFCQYDYYYLVKLLISNKDKLASDDIRYALVCAVLNGNTDIIKLLLSNLEFNINSLHYKKSLLYIAVEKQNFDTVKYLLSVPKIDVNLPYENGEEKYDYELKTPLVLAIENGNKFIAKLLLSSPKIDVNFINKHNEYEDLYKTQLYVRIKKAALNVAVKLKNIEIVSLLLANRNIDVNIYYEHYNKKFVNKEKTSLCIAVKNGDIDMIKLLLSHPKIDVNIPYKYTEEHYCYTADQKTFNIKKETVLYKAVEMGNIDIVSLLLTFPKIDVNFYNKNYNKLTSAMIEDVDIENFGLTWQDFAYNYKLILTKLFNTILIK